MDGCADFQGVWIVWVYHITWLMNSVCHTWGSQSWNTQMIYLGTTGGWRCYHFGEGWHNNHHAFECSARHGLEWWQIDMTKVRGVASVGSGAGD
ncbi:hypothetical protein QJS10_CPB14g01083 [Acorus calamus]|uniref:Fatty acid desaturase domain-containing protein n=1 Tax=Acorus calamus TaxID=4465 RepID=A0AAV9DBH6_ACOCL|nr:hypothetical protein QJS10_CPB14g01083 [Acorus calamus]